MLSLFLLHVQLAMMIVTYIACKKTKRVLDEQTKRAREYTGAVRCYECIHYTDEGECLRCYNETGVRCKRKPNDYCSGGLRDLTLRDW